MPERAEADVPALIEQHLDDAESGWSMGAPGAIAEFVRSSDEPALRTAGAVATDRGGIRVTVPPGCRLLAYETPAGPDDHWNHAVALCLPVAEAYRACRRVVTELGADPAPLRSQDAGAVLFDLGLGTPTVDACVRTADPELLEILRAGCGRPLFEPGSPLAAALVVAAPHRVFDTALGRVEVYAVIPPPSGRSPDGPHTHLLPALMRAGRTHGATVPVPDGWVPCAHLYPPHPLTDRNGLPRPFDPARLASFEELLARYGDPAQAQIATAVRAAVRAGHGPAAGPHPSDPPGRAALAVALRKLAHIGAPDGVLTGWRRSTPAPTDLLDPGGDRNSG
ncbi:DUF6925 family protein [Pseudonocardia sp. CA-142604]|uniref:DUF6925 family protein n=1 Tax=Pseudonocardia sp. CA-142604 TaxID=3240024 RepID=UPI003D92AFAA